MRIAIVGGGLVGLGTALELIRREPAAEVTVLEKEPRVGSHQSTHNSGVLHAGLYYKPGSLKAQLAVRGIRRMIEFCQEHGVAYEVCGKLVVATTEPEVTRLRQLLERGTANGLRGLRWLRSEELKEVEPHVAGVAGVHVPEEGIVDYQGVCTAMAAEIGRRGGIVRVGSRVEKVVPDGDAHRICSTTGDFAADFVINCAGLHCDRVAAAAGVHRPPRIVPFRGEYYKLRASAEHLVRHLIYPVPDPTFPFLGVHFTRLIAGGVEAGPNAVLAWSREGYSKTQIRAGDLLDAIAYPGLWRFMRRHRRMAWEEVRRSFSRGLFCASLQRLVPELEETDLEPGGAGVRAQAMLEDGTLLQDFHLIEGPGMLHVLNAPSPAATASLAIGGYIAERVLGRVGSAHALSHGS